MILSTQNQDLIKPASRLIDILKELPLSPGTEGRALAALATVDPSALLNVLLNKTDWVYLPGQFLFGTVAGSPARLLENCGIVLDMLALAPNALHRLRMPNSKRSLGVVISRIFMAICRKSIVASLCPLPDAGAGIWIAFLGAVYPAQGVPTSCIIAGLECGLLALLGRVATALRCVTFSSRSMKIFEDLALRVLQPALVWPAVIRAFHQANIRDAVLIDNATSVKWQPLVQLLWNFSEARKIKKRLNREISHAKCAHHQAMYPLAFYCSRDCQKADWRAGHKLVCAYKDLHEPMLIVDSSGILRVERSSTLRFDTRCFIRRLTLSMMKGRGSGAEEVQSVQMVNFVKDEARTALPVPRKNLLPGHVYIFAVFRRDTDTIVLEVARMPHSEFHALVTPKKGRKHRS
ncbi:uncharacterized protein SCHCODRAFT_01084550 [Schizophyllum commune H4-8]|nr:uncharacterized protein SCHCODRAFT_01084550 [Schizophyllum commune H4-8]KAI5899604.1 hypothetical protein SCHCODRAFT_01084550 [Schizophyllum commune H4-8]